MRYRLFVYGTLKRGFCNHHYLKRARFLGEATTKERYPLIAPKKIYPYLIYKPGFGHYVKGELYEVDIKDMKRIDRLEETPVYYRKKEIAICQGKKSHKALCYFLAFPIPLRPPFLKEFVAQKE